MKDREHHELVEVGAVTLDAGLLAHDRVAAVATDNIVGLQEFVRAALPS